MTGFVEARLEAIAIRHLHIAHLALETLAPLIKIEVELGVTRPTQQQVANPDQKGRPEEDPKEEVEDVPEPGQNAQVSQQPQGTKAD